MTVGEWQAQVIEGAGKMLVYTLSQMPEERLNWCPCTDAAFNSRSALDQVAECITVNRRTAATLRGETPAGDGEPQQLTDIGEATTQFQESIHAFSTAVKELTDEGWQRAYTTGFGPLTGAQLIQIVTANLYYHFGQINFIQTLYGDTKFHVPPDMFS